MTSLRLGLLLGWAPPPNLASRLLISWAEHFTTLEFYLGTADTIPGLYDFLAAANRVREVRIDLGADLISAAKADHILSKLHISELSVWGYWMPSLFPQTLQKLSILIGHHFSDPGHDEPSFQESQADSVLYRIERLPKLHTLRIKFNPEYAIRLSCPVQLHSLRSLHLRFAVEDEDPATLDYDLSWVHRQPAITDLSVEIFLASQHLGQHAAIVQQLMGLKISTLLLDLRGPFISECQTLWAGLPSVHTLQLGLFDASAFGTPTDAVAMLPGSCARVSIEPRLHGQMPLYVTWEALTRHAANIRIVTASPFSEDAGILHLYLLGECDLARIRSFRRPWQLSIGSTAVVHGLPVEQPAGSAYLLQNAAARAAGWTAETF